MFIDQISIFIENRQGRMAEITKLLADGGIDIRALSIADTTDYGILRLIVNNPEKATELLTANKNLLDTMARLLIEKETIYQEEVDLIMEGKDVATIIEFMDKKQAERDVNPFKKVETKIVEAPAPVVEKAEEVKTEEKLEEPKSEEKTDDAKEEENKQ